MAHHTEFKRMLLGLPQSAADYEMVGVTARLAELLQLNLVAMFVEDRSLIDIAGLPCVRELRALGGGWQPIEIGQLTAELEHAAATAHRLFADIARNCSVETSFRVEKGSAADVIGSLGDGRRHRRHHRAEESGRKGKSTIHSAGRRGVPSLRGGDDHSESRGQSHAGRLSRWRADPDDPSIDAAMGIAAAAHERLIVVGPFEKIGVECILGDVSPSRPVFELNSFGAGRGRSRRLLCRRSSAIEGTSHSHKPRYAYGCGSVRRCVAAIDAGRDPGAGAAPPLPARRIVLTMADVGVCAPVHQAG